MEKLPAEFPCGVYYGWAQVGLNGAVHKMVMSVGWNPFYDNKTKSMVSTWLFFNVGNVSIVGLMNYCL